VILGVVHEKVQRAPRITMWVAISSHGLLGPVFFEETVNNGHYLIMLCSTFVPELATALPLQTQWFMQDGARLRMLFWTFYMTLLTHVSSQTDFLIILHVDRTAPPPSQYS
jgi:hypothetical protein